MFLSLSLSLSLSHSVFRPFLCFFLFISCSFSLSSFFAFRLFAPRFLFQPVSFFPFFPHVPSHSFLNVLSFSVFFSLISCSLFPSFYVSFWPSHFPSLYPFLFCFFFSFTIPPFPLLASSLSTVAIHFIKQQLLLRTICTKRSTDLQTCLVRQRENSVLFCYVNVRFL